MLRPWNGLRRFWRVPTRIRTIVLHRYTFRPRLEQLESRLVLSTNVVNNFNGLVSGGPPDTCGAAGPNSYVETVNSTVSIYNKSTGATIASDNLGHFFYTTGGITPVPGGGLADATMCYDEPIGRFIVGDLDANSTDGGALDIAVSKNSNPTTLDGSNWYFYQLDMSEANESADYPGNLGFNADAFVFTFNMFNLGGGSNHTEVAAIPQSPLTTGSGFTYYTYDLGGLSYRPVTMHDSVSGGPMWFVQEGGGNNSINITRMDNVLSGSAGFTTFNRGVNSYGNVNAPLNPDGSVITNLIDNRILKAAEANNTIVACQHIGVGATEDDARWYEINVSDINNPVVVNQGNYGFGNNTYTVYPSIDINPAGDIGLAFTSSGPDFSTDYMSAYVTGMNPSDGGSMEGTAFYIGSGDSNNHDGREGDFSGINVDPNGSFWTAQEITTGSSGATVIANFTLSNAGEAFVKNGVLEVTGTNANDNVTLQPNPGNFGQTEVIDNGVDLGDFNNGSFSSINVALFGGDDSLAITDNGGSSGMDFYNGVAITYDGGTGTNAVLVDDSTAGFSDTYTITSSTVSRPFFGGLTYSNVQNVTLSAESGNNTININSTSAAVTINDNAGSDTVNLSDGVQANGLDNLQGHVTVNGGGSDVVNLNDQSATFSDTYTITSSTVSRIIFGGLTYSNIAGLTLNAETGNNTINILSTTFGIPVTINDDAGSDTVNLSDGVQANGLDNLQGHVTVNGGGSDVVNLNDQSATFSDTYTITSSTVSRIIFGGLTYSNIAGLTLNAETGNNTININSTAAGTPVTINDDAGSDTVNIGNGDLNAMLGAVTVNGAGGTTAVIVNDQSNAAVHTYTITATTVGRSGFGGLTYSSLASLTLNGGSAVDTYNIQSTAAGSIVTVNGGAGSDTFNLGGGNKLNGIQGALTVKGGGGTNTLNANDSSSSTGQSYTLSSTQLTRTGIAAISYASLAALHITASGNDILTLLTPVPTAATTFNGGSGSNKLQGANVANTWTISGANAGMLGKVTFSNVQYLIGGTLNDSFKMQTAGSVAGTINGGGGTDTLDYSGRTAGVTVNLTAGTATSTGGVSNIANVIGTPGNDKLTGGSGTNTLTAGGGTDVLTGGSGTETFILGSTQAAATTVTGGSGSNTLVGANIANTWTLTGANAGNVNGIAFTGIQNLKGGTAADTFKVQSGGSLSGTITGGGGSDKLDYSADGGVAATVNLATSAATAIHGGAAAGFSGLSAFIGSSASDLLIGPNATNVWTITGTNAGTVNTFSFTGFENLQGGTGTDTFSFTSSTASVSGTLNGGGGTGNKISYSTLGSSFLVNVTLTSNTSGTAPLLTNPFVNINSVAGSTDTANTLTAPNTTNTWTISGANAGNVNTGPATAFAFTGMPNLVGGTGVDTFKFSSTSGSELSLKGGGAPSGKGDWLNYAAFGSATTVTVNLATNSATNVNGGLAGAITGIQNVLGSGTGTNKLTGSSQGNILIGGSGTNTIVGGSGNSLLIGGSGHGSITGGSGQDILIAGTTTYNATTTAGQTSLMAILAELQSADSFAQKVYDLIHGTDSGDPTPGGHDLNGSNKLTWGGTSPTVKASTGAFTLAGDTSASTKADWFFSNASSTVSDFNDDGVNDEHNNNALGVI